jgi:general secretion pathway protein F
MRFELKAIEPGGAVAALELQAPDAAAAVKTLEARGYTVLSVRGQRSLGALWRRGGERFPVALFSQELRALVGAGLPLVEAIETLAQKEKRDEFRAILLRIVALLREGQPLSAALEELPQAFPPLYIATVKAAERTSDLAPALARYVSYASQLDAVKKRIVNASIYPALLIAVGGLVTLFLLLYVVPRFGHIYQDRGTDLPLFSRLLLGWGQAIDQNGPAAVGILVSLAMAGVYALRMESVRRQIGDALWRIPSLGERLKVFQLARFYRTIGMLLRGGMPLPRALEMGADLLHPLLRDRLTSARRSIDEGRGVSASLEAQGLVTPVAVRMLAVGEKSGNMGEMLEQVAAFHDEELARWVDWFTRLFEPLLMAIIGLVIGAIVVLMYMPIFELAGNIQ